MAVTTTNTNKPINPRGDDKSPLAFNRAKIYSGKALDFDGVNDNVDLDGFTMAGNVATIVFQAKFSNDQYLLDIDTQRFVIRNRAASGFGVFNTTAWTDYGDTLRDELGFYAIVNDGTTQRVYYNGHQLGSDATVTALDWDSATKVKIGSNNTGTNNFFDGQIAGVKIFNTALTAAQVADLYNNPEKIVPTGVSNDALKLWLPMQEGAGTTAYDGSGNGNHGTISGATYTHGIGAPVSQTAVIDWNKGQNYVVQSNNFSTSWTTPRSTLTSGQSGILGSSDAWKIESNDTGYTGGYYNTTSLNVVNCSSIYAKAGNIDYIFIASTQGSTNNAQYFNLSTGTLGSLVGSGITSADIEDVGDGWYRCSVVMSANASFGYMLFGIANTDANNGSVSGEYIYVQNAQLNNGTSVGPYIPTLSTAQTSEVLLPAGLTSGRDITGVNLFENVRKQYALNLDGNSWAEVHDNESLDFGTGSFTLEAWVKAAYINTGSSYNVILNLGDVTGTSATIVSSSTSIHFFYGGEISHPTTNDGSWVHIVGTYDGTNVTLYINGVQVNQAARTAIDTTNDLVKTIGRDTTTTRNYKDQIAQPRIYNRALTADEVEQNYNAGKNTYS